MVAESNIGIDEWWREMVGRLTVAIRVQVECQGCQTADQHGPDHVWEARQVTFQAMPAARVTRPTVRTCGLIMLLWVSSVCAGAAGLRHAISGPKKCLIWLAASTRPHPR